jgi:ATP-dependent protease HslVU (ClpYQ) peptidase subunit
VAVPSVSDYFEKIEKRENELKRKAFEEIKDVMKRERHKIMSFDFMRRKVEATVLCHDTTFVVIAYVEFEVEFENETIRFQVVSREIDGEEVYDELWGAGKNLQTLIENLF